MLSNVYFSFAQSHLLRDTYFLLVFLLALKPEKILFLSLHIKYLQVTSLTHQKLPLAHTATHISDLTKTFTQDHPISPYTFINFNCFVSQYSTLLPFLFQKFS